MDTKTAEEILPKGEDIALYQGDTRYDMVDREDRGGPKNS